MRRKKNRPYVPTAYFIRVNVGRCSPHFQYFAITKEKPSCPPQHITIFGVANCKLRDANKLWIFFSAWNTCRRKSEWNMDSRRKVIHLKCAEVKRTFTHTLCIFFAGALCVIIGKICRSINWGENDNSHRIFLRIVRRELSGKNGKLSK